MKQQCTACGNSYPKNLLQCLCGEPTKLLHVELPASAVRALRREGWPGFWNEIEKCVRGTIGN